MIVSRFRPSSVRTPAQERLYPAQDPFVPDPTTYPPHQGGVVDLVEARLDVRLEHPLIVPSGRGEVVDLGDRVLCSTPRTETIGTWLEVRLEDRLEHQFQRSLHDPVAGSRDPQRTDLARRLGNRLLPHPKRHEHASLQVLTDPGQQIRDRPTDTAGSDPIDTSGSCALVAPHPVPRHDQERRVIDKVREVIEATTRIGHRPSVQLLLHPQYPPLGLVPLGKEIEPRLAGIHQRTPGAAWLLRTRWTPSPCDRLSRPRTTTGPPPHLGRIGRRRAFPPTSRMLAGEGTAEMVPTFTIEPFDGVGAQLCPCSIATATPQTFTVAFGPATSPSPEVPPTITPTPHSAVSRSGCALLSSPDPPDSSWWLS